MKRSLVVVALLVAPLAVPADAPGVAAPAPEIGTLEQALPPGARNLLSVFRVVKSLNARNRVYHEARDVQGDLRAYYDAQIDTAKQQLTNREQLGLGPSQLRAYLRVVERLEGERQLVLDLTEDEKKGAKYGFESRLLNELKSALIRTPRAQEVVERVRATVGDLGTAVEQVQGVLETGNPVSATIGRIEEVVERVEAFGEIVDIVHGPTGEQLTSVTDRVRGLMEEVQAPIDEALERTNILRNEIDGLTTDLDEQIDANRTVRADTAIRDAALVTTAQMIFAPHSDTPDIDVMADAITRGHSRDTADDIGTAGQVLDVSEFNSMRDRVRAALLGNTLERISDICGRIIGEARRLQMAAALAGEPPPDTSSPCGLFRNPEALQAFIDAQRSTTTTIADDAPDTSVDGSTTTTTESVEDEAERTRRELIEQAAGVYLLSGDIEAGLLAYQAESSATISNVETQGAITLGADGTVTGDVGYSYRLTLELDGELIVDVFGVEFDMAPADVVVEGERLVFTATTNFVAAHDGERYIDQEAGATGMFDPATDEVVVEGFWESAVTFARTSP